jgi:hypothetical protein
MFFIYLYHSGISVAPTFSSHHCQDDDDDDDDDDEGMTKLHNFQ